MKRLSHRVLVGCFACALLAVSPEFGWAQASDSIHPVAAASRLRDAREFAAAAALLREHLRQHPDDGDAARMLAQTLYWMGDVRAAQAQYEAALARHPDDVRLRLEFGRMLVESHRPTQARALLEPLRQDSAAAAEAESLLGTLAYWQGDLTAANRHFAGALGRNPQHAEARRQRGEIQAGAAPWVRFGGEAGRDDQPLERVAVSGEAGWYLTPLQSLAVRVHPQRIAAGSTTETLLAGEATAAGFWPRARLETEATLGLLQRSAASDPLWTGRLGLGVRLPEYLVLRIRAERAPYLWTRQSLATPVTTESAAGLVDWGDPRGWIGQAGYTVQRYPDANRVHTTHAWALAPVVRRPSAELKLGYGFAYQDAEQSRFVFAPGSLVGLYQPYYTPEGVQAHSATGAIMLRPGPELQLRASGAYGVYARERAPFVWADADTVPQMGSYQRTFHPWNARASLTGFHASGFTASLFGEHLRNAFYASSSLGVDVMYRLRRN